MSLSRRTPAQVPAEPALPARDAPARQGAMPEPREHEAADYEASPLSRAEYISAVVHLYRGELHRATVQRTRLDLTTNWAVLTTAGLLAFSFRQGDNPHWAILLGMALISLFLVFEARRYQMFDVWRSRVRKIEENFYGPILRRNPVSPHREWGERVARDLFLPSYKISFLAALRTRFLRNYWAIFTVLLFAWVLKVSVYPGGSEGRESETWAHIRSNLQFGMVAWWIPLVFLACFLAVAAGLVFLVPASPPADNPEEGFWVGPQDEAESRPLDL